VSERITLYVVRGFFLLVCAGLGLYLYNNEHGLESAVDVAPYIFIACGGALMVILVESLSARKGASTLSSIVFGLILGLVLSILFRPLIVLIFEALGTEQQEMSIRFVNLVTTVLLCYFGVTLLLHTQGRFKFIVPFVEFRKEDKDHRPVLLDTSVLVDGRIGELLQTGIIRCRVFVPRFVVEELHTLSDSTEKVKRERGRRGLELLDRLRRNHGVELLPASGEPGQVDVVLLDLAHSLDGWILTTDATLRARGKVQNVDVINLNDVADALRILAVPGQTLRVEILRKGEERDQGVGFMPDGTMVVVEGGRGAIGKTVEVEVTGTIRTSAGRMVFARLLETV